MLHLKTQLDPELRSERLRCEFCGKTIWAGMHEDGDVPDFTDDPEEHARSEDSCAKGRYIDRE